MYLSIFLVEVETVEFEVNLPEIMIQSFGELLPEFLEMLTSPSIGANFSGEQRFAQGKSFLNPKL